MSKSDATEIAYCFASNMLFTFIEITDTGVDDVENNLAVYIFCLLFSALLGGLPYLIYKYIIANRDINVNTFFYKFLFIYNRKIQPITK